MHRRPVGRDEDVLPLARIACQVQFPRLDHEVVGIETGAIVAEVRDLVRRRVAPSVVKVSPASISHHRQLMDIRVNPEYPSRGRMVCVAEVHLHILLMRDPPVGKPTSEFIVEAPIAVPLKPRPHLCGRKRGEDAKEFLGFVNLNVGQHGVHRVSKIADGRRAGRPRGRGALYRSRWLLVDAVSEIPNLCILASEGVA